MTSPSSRGPVKRITASRSPEKKGYLALELKSAYGMWTQDFAVTAKVTADGKDTYVNAPPQERLHTVR
ncbi:hypothetical protein GCM10020000_11730 [Streptomyces olivoverticillatus]